MKRFAFLLAFGLYFTGTIGVLGQKKDPVMETIKKQPIKIVAFELVHQAPQHPDCSDTAKDPQGRRCLTQTLVAKISSEFNTRLLSGTNNGKRRIIITSLIDENGKIGFTSTNSKDDIFDKEIKRIITSLPKLSPGLHMRKPTRVRLRLPVTFVVSD